LWLWGSLWGGRRGGSGLLREGRRVEGAEVEQAPTTEEEVGVERLPRAAVVIVVIAAADDDEEEEEEEIAPAFALLPVAARGRRGATAPRMSSETRERRRKEPTLLSRSLGSEVESSCFSFLCFPFVLVGRALARGERRKKKLRPLSSYSLSPSLALFLSLSLPPRETPDLT
jgi:hypothetical protein